MQLHSPAFDDDQTLPQAYTCDGKDLSPPLGWTGTPAGAKSFVLFADDPDAPGQTFIHWVAYNIPAALTGLAEGQSGIETPGFLQGLNSKGEKGFMGACPPTGHGAHRYNFRLYALNTVLDIEDGADKETVGQAMNGHVLAEARLTARYART